MSRRTKMIGVILALVAMVAFAFSLPIYQWFWLRAASKTLYARTQALVEQNPQLQPEWDKALEDGVLTYPEAKDIVEKAGEKVSPDE